MSYKDCPHSHFDMTQPMGNGYVRCADCGRGIPIEKVACLLADRIEDLEQRFDAHMLGKPIEGAAE